METANQNGVAEKNGTAKQINAKAPHNGEATKTDGAQPAQAATTGTPEKPKLVKVEEAKSAAQQPVEAAKPVTPTLNLESKLKVVEDLHRRSIQRINLISRIKQLEGFEVTLTKENDELEENPYQGCKLIIEDDKKRQFVTTTPGLIRLVSQFIFNACHEKLADIEASIVFPNI